MLLTVFTPTYNRAYILHRLYRSLCNLNDNDFEWIVVDDGSCDNTEEIVESFIAENKINICFFKIEHQGKHVAYNVGLKEARGKFFVNIDSDDCIAPDAINLLKNVSTYITGNVAGILAMKSNIQGKILGNMFRNPGTILPLKKIQEKELRGEYAYIFLTEIARKYPYPVIKGETFMPDSIVFKNLKDFNYLICNDIIEICEYLPDGLSARWDRIRFENPLGFMLYFKEQADRTSNPVTLIENLIKYNHYRHIALLHGKRTYYTGKHRLLSSFLIPISNILGMKDFTRLVAAYGK